MSLFNEHGIVIECESASSADGMMLIKKLSEELASRYGGDGSGSFNASDTEVPKSCFVIARLENKAVACGALRPMEGSIAEVKRMYVVKEMRGKGISIKILNALEKYAREFSYKKIWLETGVMQPEAISLYEKAGYKRIKNYGEYENNPLSICYEKIIE